jgi:hypothetical protein
MYAWRRYDIPTSGLNSIRLAVTARTRNLAGLHYERTTDPGH